MSEWGLLKSTCFPTWLRELFPPIAKDTHSFGETVSWPKYSFAEKQGHSGTKQLKVVCSQCNSGWMSLIDHKVRPIVVPLLKGLSSSIDGPSQKKLATWLSTSTMVRDFSIAGKSYVPQSHRDHVRNRSEPPEQWQVWIGSYWEPRVASPLNEPDSRASQAPTSRRR